jgi:hypothetical protein
VATGVDGEAVAAGVETGATIAGLTGGIAVTAASGGVVRSGAGRVGGSVSGAALGALAELTGVTLGSTIGAFTDAVCGGAVDLTLDASVVVVATGRTPIVCVAPHKGQNFAAAAMSRPHDVHDRVSALASGVDSAAVAAAIGDAAAGGPLAAV